MHKIINKLWKKSGKEAFNEILEKHKKKSYSIVNYIYGGNITSRNLFDKNKTENQKKYYKALLDSTMLLPDGISLQIFVFLYFLFFKKKLFRINNLNGTDYLGYFLQELKKKTNNIKLILYGTTSDAIKRSVSFFESEGYEIVYYQDGFSDFKRDKLEEKLTIHQKKHQKKTFYLFIQGRTTPKIALQELRTLENIKKIKEKGFFVFNQGGMFDFDQRGGKEIRAPKLIRKIKCERLRKSIFYPEKGGRNKIMYNIKLIPLVFNKIILKK